MAEAKRPRTGKRYRVGNPRGIPDGVPVAELPNGKQLFAGKYVTAAQLDSESRELLAERGIIEG